MFLGRSRQVKLLRQKRRGDPSGVNYIKLNTILTECSWGDPDRLKLYDKKLWGDPNRVYNIDLNQVLAEHTWAKT